MALSTNQQNDINTMCSRAKDYSIGSRLTNMTTAGAYNDGTAAVGAVAGTITDGTASLVGGVLSGVTLTSPTVNDPTIEGLDLDSLAAPTTDMYATNDSEATSTSYTGKMVKGFYELYTSDTGSFVFEMTSTPVAEDIVTLHAYGTAGSTIAVVLSTANVIGVVGSTAKCCLHMKMGDSITLCAQTTTLWRIMSAYSHSTNAWGNHGLSTQATA